MDWKKARKSLPFAGSGAGGNKKVAPCPHCGSPSYGYHGGRFKRCLLCGYDRQMEMLFDAVRYRKVRGYDSGLSEVTEQMAEEYYSHVYQNGR